MFGVVVSLRRSGQYRNVTQPRHPYWIACGVHSIFHVTIHQVSADNSGHSVSKLKGCIPYRAEWVQWSYMGVGEGTVTVQIFLRYKGGAVFQIFSFGFMSVLFS